MKNMKIFNRLLVSFSLVIVLALAIGLVGMFMTTAISDDATTIYDKHVMGMKYLALASGNWDGMEIAMFQAVHGGMKGNINELNKYADEFEKQRKELVTNLSNVAPTIVSEEAKAKLNEFESSVGPYSSDAVKIFELCKNADANKAAIYAALESIDVSTLKLDGVLSSLIDTKSEMAAELNTDTDNMSMLATVVEIILLVIVVGFSLIVAIFIATGIEKSLKEIIEKLSMATSHISSSSSELTSSSENLATGSSRQAAAIEETSATMNETASMVQQNAENTRVASQIATDATTSVTEAGRVMGELMETMSELKESSDKVSKIVKTIDNIAFQTNLLAINATVEAARAGGDAGRSFAVVAQEVRSLAQKSADASKETAEIIEKNIDLTDTSRSAAEQVMTIAQTNAQQITDLGKLISEINAASEEQSSGIKQINIAVSQMEKVTQENAAVAEENAASSNSMLDEIANLEDAVTIAKSLIRNAESTGLSFGSGSRPSGGSSVNRTHSTSYSSGSSAGRTASSSTTQSSYKPAGTSASSVSAKKKTDADKIIPLDDNDDF